MPVAFFESGGAESIDTENLNGPLVVVLMDAIGIREELREVARALNELGYSVALPNLYYREGRCEDMDFGTPEGHETIMRLYMGLSHEMVSSDMKFLLASLAHDEPVGLLGYCMGGANALVLAGAYPQFIRAAAAIHPGGIVKEAKDSPHKMAAQASGELYIAIADDDPYATVEQVATLDRTLKQSEVSYHLECYKGAAHGFAFKSLPSYNADAAARYWQATVDLFERNLK